LEHGFLLSALRKPDFQRETSDWSPAKVLDLIRTFLDGDLVPAVILWQAEGKVFVIDGAHRLGALLAWVHNDYGDGERSRTFFRNQIPQAQIKVADRTRKLIHAEIGAYAEYAAAANNVGTADDKIKIRIGNMGIIAMPVQWIPAVTSKQAEDSFFKINQAATPIDPTELRILKARASANNLAARAIIRSGTGHQYWSKFEEGVQSEIKAYGKKIYNALYDPPLDTPIKTLDLPVAGRGYGTLPFVFDLVNLSNSVRISDSTRKNVTKDNLSADEDGTQTVIFLKNVQKRVSRITGAGPESLGLHPAVYFYTLGGIFQPTAFLATSDFIEGLDQKGELVNFTEARKEFEEFFIRNKVFITQVIHKQGSGARSLNRLKTLMARILNEIWGGKNAKQIEESLRVDPEFSFLISEEIVSPEGDKMDFSRGAKSAAFLKEALNSAIRCGVCGARVHKNSMNVDHMHRKQDGGGATLENASMTHPFCNSTVKG
jgi:hypothetical protein